MKFVTNGNVKNAAEIVGRFCAKLNADVYTRNRYHGNINIKNCLNGKLLLGLNFMYILFIFKRSLIRLL